MDKELQNKKLDLFKNIKFYDQSEVINKFFFVSFFNFLIAMAKGHRYQSSWCKKGLLSISQNLERKYSRMDNMMFPISGEILNVEKMGLGASDGFLDTLSDEANYCNLALTFFMLKGKENDFIKNEINKSFIDSQLKFIKENFDASVGVDYLKDIISNIGELVSNLQKILESEDKRDFDKLFIDLQNLLN